MDIHKLEIFIDLSETLNYTETAEHQFTTQGNISKKIKALEKDLAVQLFRRSHRKITLTEAGTLALPHAKEIVISYHTLKDTLNSYQTAKNLSLTIYTHPTMSNYQGFSSIMNFLKLHPEITVHLQEFESNELVSYLIEEKSDLIFTRIFDTLEKNLEQIVTEDDQFVAILPSNHPLAAKKEIYLAELQLDHFLLLGKDTNLLHPVINLCHEAGFEPDITHEGTRIDLIMNMVSSDLGISILMKNAVQHHLNSKTVAIPIKPNLLSQLSFIRKKGANSKASNIFWHYLQNMYYH